MLLACMIINGGGLLDNWAFLLCISHDLRSLCYWVSYTITPSMPFAPANILGWSYSLFTIDAVPIVSFLNPVTFHIIKTCGFPPPHYTFHAHNNDTLVHTPSHFICCSAMLLQSHYWYVFCTIVQWTLPMGSMPSLMWCGMTFFLLVLMSPVPIAGSYLTIPP